MARDCELGTATWLRARPAGSGDVRLARRVTRPRRNGSLSLRAPQWGCELEPHTADTIPHRRPRRRSHRHAHTRGSIACAHRCTGGSKRTGLRIRSSGCSCKRRAPTGAGELCRPHRPHAAGFGKERPPRRRPTWHRREVSSHPGWSCPRWCRPSAVPARGPRWPTILLHRLCESFPFESSDRAVRPKAREAG